MFRNAGRATILRLATTYSFNAKPQATEIRVAIIACGLPLNEKCVTSDEVDC